jgi:HAE1 family hydrophobic/amphiphilic exporter-1
MFTIPLAFTGGFAALFLTGNDVSIIAMVGMVMLAGIIVNNGIVFVDTINQLREEGMALRDAIVQTGKNRLRPILMTALTTILGLSTMAVGVGMGADMAQPMALVTIGGLIYGTLLTLFVVPCIYEIFNREKKKKLEEMTE